MAAISPAREAMLAVAEDAIDEMLVHGSPARTGDAREQAFAEMVVDEDEGAVPPLAATAAEAALPTLREEMPTEELREYLLNFTTTSGVKVFAEAAVDQLEFYPMKTLYSLAATSSKWQNVVDRLFDGDLATAQLFQAKVVAAKVADSKAARVAQSKLGKQEKKAQRLAELRALDEKGPEPEQPAAVAARPHDPTLDMMAAARGKVIDGSGLDQTCAACAGSNPGPHSLCLLLMVVARSVYWQAPRHGQVAAGLRPLRVRRVQGLPRQGRGARGDGRLDAHHGGHGPAEEHRQVGGRGRANGFAGRPLARDLADAPDLRVPRAVEAAPLRRGAADARGGVRHAAQDAPHEGPQLDALYQDGREGQVEYVLARIRTRDCTPGALPALRPDP